MKNSKNNNYPLGEDFYSFEIEEKEINTTDISKIKNSNENDEKMDEKYFNADESGSEQDKE
jgi:hypothetical protein